jgi:hypothetical protein
MGLCLVMVLSSPSQLSAQEQKKNLDDPELVDKVHNAVVFLFADARAAGEGVAGSGFVLDTSGLVVTNFHVVDGMCAVLRDGGDKTKITISAEGGENLGEPQLIAWNEKRDLAVLRLPHRPGAGVRLADSDQLRLGQPVVALGFPWSLNLGFNLTFSKGNVSAKRVLEGLNTVQHTATIAPGSSGGPLFNTSGEVVGVNVAIKAVEVEGERAASPGNVNWAIPSNDVRQLLAQTGEPVALRKFCSGRSTRADESKASARLIYQSEPQCLEPGTRTQLSGDFQAGQTYLLAVKRLQGSAKLVFGIGSSSADFQGTDKENEEGILLLTYTPAHSGSYNVIIGASSGRERTCFLLALFAVQREGK